MSNSNVLWLGILFLLAITSGPSLAQSSVAEILEQARERARQVEEIKQVLNDPDQNVRLAAFEAMAASGDPLMRELALDAGLASSDQILRGLALKHTVLGLRQLTLTLTADPSAPKAVQERVQTYLEKIGRNLQLVIDPEQADPGTGYFQGDRSSYTGNVSGLVVTFNYGYHSGELYLQDDGTLAGTVNYSYGGDHQFKATAPLR